MHAVPNRPFAGIPLLLVLALGACQSSPPVETVRSRAEIIVGDMPAWFASPPATEGGWVYAAGTDQSADAQFAVDRALLAATRTLALQQATHIAATSRDFMTESGPSEARRQNGQADRTTKMSVVALLGPYTVMETKLVPMGSQYRAYVLIRATRPDASAASFRDDSNQSKAKSEDDKAKAEADKAYQALEKDEPPAPRAAPRQKVTSFIVAPPEDKGDTP